MTESTRRRFSDPLIKAHKSHSPRLTLRRSPRRSSAKDRVCLGTGLENNDSSQSNTETGQQCQLSPVQPVAHCSRKEPKSVARTEASILKKRGRRKQEGRLVDHARTSDSPVSPPSKLSLPNTRAPPSLTNTKPDGKDPFEFVDDEALVPLTPRNFSIDPSAVLDDDQFTSTPPVNPPTPLFVSAKRHGNNVRKKSYATKRRRFSDEDVISEEDDTMKLPEGLSPAEKAREYWKRCYGEPQPQSMQINPQTSWSAKRAAPTKGWYVGPLIVYFLSIPLLFSSACIMTY